MKVYTATPEEFATGHAHTRAVHMFNGRNRKPLPPRPKLPPFKQLDRQVGAITPEQFQQGSVYQTPRRHGHRTVASPEIKPVAESLTDLILDLHDHYGSAFPRPSGAIIQFTVVDEQTTYKKAQKKIVGILSSHGLLPAQMDITPKEPGPTNYRIVVPRRLLM